MIDARAIVAKTAQLGDNVIVGPYAVIEDHVEIGSNTKIGSHTVIHSFTTIGCDNQISEFVSLGGAPQSIHYKNTPSRLAIGDNNVVREFVTMHRGAGDESSVTRIGNNNFIMAYAHIAHDCSVGDQSIFANNASLAGYVEVGDCVFLGGFTLIHQHCRIGPYSITGINTVCRQDVAPFVVVAGNPPTVSGMNTRGLKKRNFSQQSISALKKVYQFYFRQRMNIEATQQQLEKSGLLDENTQQFMSFVSTSERGVIRTSKKQTQQA